MIKKEQLSAKDAIAKIPDGSVIMIGGFMGCGSPEGLLKALLESGKKNLTFICNDAGAYNEKTGRITGVAPNVLGKQFSKAIVSHIGLNAEIQRQMNAGETEVTLVPQGTLAERIRAAGHGLGGILTPTGVGTEVEEGKQVLEVNGKKYLLEEPLKADFALLHATTGDEYGNLTYSRTSRNFGPLMAMAADTVIAEIDDIVKPGEIDPECVVTPSVLVHYIVQGTPGK